MPGRLLLGRACVLSGWNAHHWRSSAVILPTERTVFSVELPGQGAPILTHSRNRSICSFGQFSFGGHAELVVGVADGLEYEALVGFAGHEGRAAVASLEKGAQGIHH